MEPGEQSEYKLVEGSYPDEPLDKHESNQGAEAGQIADPVESQIVQTRPRHPAGYISCETHPYSQLLIDTLEDTLPFYEPRFRYIQDQQWQQRTSIRFRENFNNSSNQEHRAAHPLQSINRDPVVISSPRVVQEREEQYLKQMECERMLHLADNNRSERCLNRDPYTHGQARGVNERQSGLSYEDLMVLAWEESPESRDRFRYERIRDWLWHGHYANTQRTSPYDDYLFSPPVTPRVNTNWNTQIQSGPQGHAPWINMGETSQTHLGQPTQSNRGQPQWRQQTRLNRWHQDHVQWMQGTHCNRGCPSQTQWRYPTHYGRGKPSQTRGNTEARLGRGQNQWRYPTQWRQQTHFSRGQPSQTRGNTGAHFGRDQNKWNRPAQWRQPTHFSRGQPSQTRGNIVARLGRGQNQWNRRTLWAMDQLSRTQLSTAESGQYPWSQQTRFSLYPIREVQERGSHDAISRPYTGPVLQDLEDGLDIGGQGHNCNFCNHNLSQEIGSHIPEAYDPPVVAVLPCGHVFHNDCFNFFDSSENPSNPRCIICAPNCSEIFPTL